MGKIMANISQMEATGELSKHYFSFRAAWEGFFCYILYSAASAPCKITKQTLKCLKFCLKLTERWRIRRMNFSCSRNNNVSSTLKGIVSRDGFGFWWHARFVLGQNRGRGQFLSALASHWLEDCQRRRKTANTAPSSLSAIQSASQSTFVKTQLYSTCD